MNVEASLPTDLRHDRITTSNLWDFCSLTVLLKKLRGFLNKSNPHAVLLTETDNWPRDFMPEIIHELPNRFGLDDLCNRALKDTGNFELTHLSGLSTVVEYLNLTSQFNMIIRASLLASCTDKELASLRRKEGKKERRESRLSNRLHRHWDFIFGTSLETRTKCFRLDGR